MHTIYYKIGAKSRQKMVQENITASEDRERDKGLLLDARGQAVG